MTFKSVKEPLGTRRIGAEVLSEHGDYRSQFDRLSNVAVILIARVGSVMASVAYSDCGPLSTKRYKRCANLHYAAAVNGVYSLITAT
jgi:hypothetical protein